MLKFDGRMRCLVQDDYTFELKEQQEPDLYREIFSYGQVPKVPFNFRLNPMDPPEEMWITDTTFRDGQQARPPFTVKQIVDLYEMLHHLGGKNGLIRQCEFFLYTDKDKEAVIKCLEKGYKYPEITGWIRANKKDFKLVKEMGLKETGILTSASDYHIFLKLNKNRGQAMGNYLDIVHAALDEGIIPRCHFEDITRADFYGFVVPFAKELMKLSAERKMPVKIRACDTMGYGVSFPGAMLPRSVPGIIYGLNHFAKVPSKYLEWHGHNDFYRAVSNAANAWLYGCSGANGTLLGIGERTGNTPVEALVMEYMMLRGDDDVDTTIITDIADYFRKELGHTIPPNQPLIGENFNVTLAGIHADGLMKNEEIYNIFDTKKLLNRAPGVAVSDKSGTAGVLHWVKTNLNPKNNELSKTHPGIQKIYEWITEQYTRGRITTISSEELLEQSRKHLPKLFQV
ncbi:MAG: 2-isopropylmalate synthase [Candidatus Brocadiales bacterium]